jgi:hypothetical protein
MFAPPSSPPPRILGDSHRRARFARFVFCIFSFFLARRTHAEVSASPSSRPVPARRRRASDMRARASPSRALSRDMGRKRASTTASAGARASKPRDVTLPRPDATTSRKIRHLVENEIIIVDDALSARACAAIVDAVERNDAFTESTSRGPRFGEAWRRNGRFAVEDAAFADALWDASGGRETFAFELADAKGLNPNIRVYRYRSSEHFGPHVDERVFARGFTSGYTALYYLSGACEGGRTIFYDERGDERCSVTPKAGRALYFRHGVDMPEHEGEEVRSGTKYVLRSDVLFG